MTGAALHFIEIFALWVLVVATVVLFWRRNLWAGRLRLPYVALTTFAAALNFSISHLNH
ncbi:tryptophan-rich sensory protein [Mycobacteroides salmoniphilum]|uniref:tryptophan-rich sensory protein n=1 Tax=Mycobacteroides salmoniphilum TaxID=404941 RepID=UPI00106509F7|nr:tryptophan-rich sensory protein [Mycobacteroides salmoniphilum]